MTGLFLERTSISFFAFFMTFYISCKDPNETSAEAVNWKTVKVTASAYNSLAYQNQGNPKITAWGDTLKPGMKVIAISRDLMKKGLVYNTPVKIDGLSGIFFVKDKMHHRWRNKIDIYMGEDVQKAKNWGRKKISIQYLVQKDSLIENIE
ncbi:3D (Asp-Asp-Asp) domain-containing protein [Gillisia sp. Hel_I_86]|nr:3D (Asp-Asp-Asp) domain-containing protein [Gillisia sp. Hel_I_86]